MSPTWELYDEKGSGDQVANCETFCFSCIKNKIWFEQCHTSGAPFRTSADTDYMD